MKPGGGGMGCVGGGKGGELGLRGELGCELIPGR